MHPQRRQLVRERIHGADLPQRSERRFHRLLGGRVHRPRQKLRDVFNAHFLDLEAHAFERHAQHLREGVVGQGFVGDGGEEVEAVA